VYPETVKAADRWLDSSAGRSSPFAATIRLADGSGYARSSPWCPGMANDEPEAPEEHADRMEAHVNASSSAPISGKQLGTLSMTLQPPYVWQMAAAMHAIYCGALA